MNYSSTSVRLVVIYKPPPSKKNKLNVTLFLEEFESFLEKLLTSTGPLMITGDFNFHLDVPSDCVAARFGRLLEAFNLIQHVNIATHQNGHILDLVITRASDDFLNNIRVSDPAISDHSAVHCQLSFRKPDPVGRQITYRKLRSVDRESFVRDIENSTLINYETFDNASDLAVCYNRTLSALLEQHAPIKKRVVTVRPTAPWYNDQIRKKIRTFVAEEQAYNQQRTICRTMQSCKQASF